MSYLPTILQHLGSLSIPELFTLERAVLNQLRDKNIIRDGNSIVSGYAETLCRVAFDLRSEPQSTYGFDAICKDGIKYQIKARKLSNLSSSSRQLGALRRLDSTEPPFDQLIGILFDDDHEPIKAAMIPIEVARERSKYQAHTNSWILILHDDVWKDPRVRDVTVQIRQAAKRLGDPHP